MISRSWTVHFMVNFIGQNKCFHQIFHRIPWPYIHGSRHQNRHPKWFSSIVMVKDLFLQNGGKCNAFTYTSHIQLLKKYYNLCKGTYPSYLVLKVYNGLCSSNRDMVQNMLLQWPWLWKVRINSICGFLDLENIDLDTKIVILSVLVQKLWSKTKWCPM